MRHIMLVSDLMTFDGDIRAVGRHGVAGEKPSVLARAAFELTVDHLLEAGIKGSVDELRGVSENIVVGKPINLGTGGVKLIFKGEEGEE
jgi:DNA-directed RNA polymerase subunit A"